MCFSLSGFYLAVHLFIRELVVNLELPELQTSVFNNDQSSAATAFTRVYSVSCQNNTGGSFFWCLVIKSLALSVTRCKWEVEGQVKIV